MSHNMQMYMSYDKKLLRWCNIFLVSAKEESGMCWPDPTVVGFCSHMTEKYQKDGLKVKKKIFIWKK